MSRTQKILLGGGLAIVAAIVAAWLWIGNPEPYRAVLQNRVAAATGYELIVAGEIELELLPSARLTLEDARLRNPGLPQELASASLVAFDVDRGDLLRGVLTIRELRVDGFHLNVFVDASGNSIWDVERPAAIDDTAGPSAGFPARIAAENGRLDVQNLANGRRYLLKNLQVIGNHANLRGEAFSGQANFDLEWFDSANRRTRSTAVGMIGEIEADAAAGRYAIAELDLNSTPVLLQGGVELSGYPDDPSYRANLTSNEFDARVLLQNLGVLPASEQDALAVANGSPDEAWPTSVAFSLNGDAGGLSAEAVVDTPARTVIEAGTEIRFASGLLPANVRYEMDIGELDIGALFAAGEDESVPGPPSTPALPRPERPLPDLRNLILSGSIMADALAAGALRVENLTVYTNVEDRVFDVEITPVAAFGGTLSANMRWNAATGELAGETHGENLAIAEIAPLITRFDALSGRLHADGIFSARGRSLGGLLNDLSGDASFVVTENLVNIGLIKQIFTSIAALSPSGEAIQQWPDLIRFSEIGGNLALDGGLGNEHSFDLRMDNFSAAGAGVADLQNGNFNYAVRLTMLGEPLTQTIPVSRNYQDVTWPVTCAARFSDAVSRYCRPDFNAVREIFSRLGGNVSSN